MAKQKLSPRKTIFASVYNRNRRYQNEIKNRTCVKCSNSLEIVREGFVLVCYLLVAVPEKDTTYTILQGPMHKNWPTWDRHHTTLVINHRCGQGLLIQSILCNPHFLIFQNFPLPQPLGTHCGSLWHRASLLAACYFSKANNVISLDAFFLIDGDLNCFIWNDNMAFALIIIISVVIAN